MRILFLALLSVLTTALPVQSTQAELDAQLVHKPFFLRGLWKDDKLQFDNAGQIIKRSTITSPMLSVVDIGHVELSSQSLVLTGRRIAVVYADRQPTQRDLKEKISIEIAAPSSGDYTAALAAVFSPGLGGLAPAAPDFWQNFLLQAPDAAAGSAPRKGEGTPSAGPVRRVGGGVTPPRVVYAREPEYTEQARALKVNGNSLIALNVSPEGKPVNLRIVRPLGCGLDEQAIKAVLAYRFKPATENGSPITVR